MPDKVTVYFNNRHGSRSVQIAYSNGDSLTQDTAYAGMSKVMSFNRYSSKVITFRKGGKYAKQRYSFSDDKMIRLDSLKYT
ncbi:hypothetical protein PILCRDRAFT_818371 [Piloderma croceum F 1598]|uniref:Uncharacterized protein n=1 Tax=Piloderma croceum (strain F 1598) TaxID=765440 RepID=A0A0C3FI25_PILCF|nr:hypothetical protein PILCRDRAFT_818371 [Piloderma croceum F 1598]